MLYKYFEIFNKIKRRIKYINVSNKIILDELYQEDFYSYAKKKYLKRKKLKFTFSKSIKSNYIWVCWLQGYDSAPVLVKKCIDSLNKLDGEVIVIDENNFSNYVNIPDFIFRKWKKGIISNAHFTDILRVELLIKYGGLWIDSTVYCSGNRQYEIIKKYPFFAYQLININNRDRIKSIASNWLMYSSPNSELLIILKELLYDYWKKENYAKNYFFFHVFFYAIIEENIEEWNKLLKFNNINPHVMQFLGNSTYNKDQFNEMLLCSDFHKLNWRMDCEFDNTHLKELFEKEN